MFWMLSKLVNCSSERISKPSLEAAEGGGGGAAAAAAAAAQLFRKTILLTASPAGENHNITFYNLIKTIQVM